MSINISIIGWWFAKNHKGKQGWVPAAYLKEEVPYPSPAAHLPTPPYPSPVPQPVGVDRDYIRVLYRNRRIQDRSQHTSQHTNQIPNLNQASQSQVESNPLSPPPLYTLHAPTPTRSLDAEKYKKNLQEKFKLEIDPFNKPHWMWNNDHCRLWIYTFLVGVCHCDAERSYRKAIKFEGKGPDLYNRTPAAWITEAGLRDMVFMSSFVRRSSIREPC
jgi:hypothetical protein